MYFTLNSVTFLMRKMRYSLLLQELWLINQVNIQLSPLAYQFIYKTVSPHVLIGALVWCEM
jgi:hypothetical protein